MNVIKYLALLSISLFTSTVLAAENAGTTSTLPNLEGKYFCQGYDPSDKSKYSNDISITKTGDTWFIRWVDEHGYPTAYGTGIVNPAVPDILAISYGNVTDKSMTGLLVYKINKDGSFTGLWAVKANDILGTDNCKKK